MVVLGFRWLSAVSGAGGWTRRVRQMGGFGGGGSVILALGRQCGDRRSGSVEAAGAAREDGEVL